MQIRSDFIGGNIRLVNQTQPERLLAFGRAYARAILKYEEGELR